MFMNLDTLPAGKSMFTVYVTLDPVGTPRDQMAADEVDAVGPRSFSLPRLLEEGVENYGGVNLGFFIGQTYGEKARVIGVVNQSDGYVAYDAFLHGGSDYDAGMASDLKLIRKFNDDEEN